MNEVKGRWRGDSTRRREPGRGGSRGKRSVDGKGLGSGKAGEEKTTRAGRGVCAASKEGPPREERELLEGDVRGPMDFLSLSPKLRISSPGRRTRCPKHTAPLNEIPRGVGNVMPSPRKMPLGNSFPAPHIPSHRFRLSPFSPPPRRDPTRRARSIVTGAPRCFPAPSTRSRQFRIIG